MAVGLDDKEGFAEVVLLTHPQNAPTLVRAVNTFPKLVAALKKATRIIENEIPERQWEEYCVFEFRDLIEEADNIE